MSESMQPPRKSDRTRAAILEAARDLFAARGYEGASIRDVAAAASIDASMVIRYFGSKDELFARAATIDLALPDLAAVDRARVGEALVRHFLSVWEGPRGNPGLTVLLRSATTNDFAATRMRETFAAQVLPAMARVAGGADVGERAGLVVAQLMGLALCRYVLKLPQVANMPAERIAARVGPTLQRYILGDS